MIAIDELWPALLDCRAAVQAGKGAPCDEAWVFAREASGHWRFANKKLGNVDWSAAQDRIVCSLTQPIPKHLRSLLGITAHYLDLLMAQARWRRARPVTTGSVAQSIDGYIATQTGDSQWIGNEANLVHAHRLRALHDAVLVGWKTLDQDRPALTVRKVTGENPQRISITGQSNLPARALEPLRGPTVIFKPCANKGLIGSHPFASFETIEPNEVTGRIEPAHMMLRLAQRGIRSLLVEGGGLTLSCLHAAGLLDRLDVHIAPIFLGEGIASLTTLTVDKISEALEYPAESYILDGQALMSVKFNTADE